MPMDSATPTLVGSLQLLSNVVHDGKIFYCPLDRRPGARPEADMAKLTTNNISYSFVPGLIWQDVTPDSVIALDRINTTAAGSTWPTNGNHKSDGGYVLFTNGRVEWCTSLPSALKDKTGKEIVLSP